MFENLTERLTKTFKNFMGQGTLDEKNIEGALLEVRQALLEADVALSVVTDFTANVKSKALGLEVREGLTPAQMLVKIVNEELTTLMGEANEALALTTTPPAVVLMAGLQGSGKTTSTAKLAKYLKEKLKKKVMVVSCDVYRPAAILQLERLAEEIGVVFFPSDVSMSPLNIAELALNKARVTGMDVLLVDTAGRLHVDGAMMDEIKALHRVVTPIETLFVVDGMTGQDAAVTAAAFNQALPLTGVVVTKMDGDARGGAILSIRALCGKPIKFIGMGEKVEALDPFHPERLASRILGMGDVLSLIEEMEQKADAEKAKKLAAKLKKGKGFDLEDYRDQLLQIHAMGGVSAVMSKMPGMGAIPAEVRSKVGDKSTQQMVAIINSMTPKERKNPDIILGGRKKRIANGSGTQIQDVNRLLKQYTMMQKMMKKMMSKGGMSKMMGRFQSMAGGMPPRF